MRIAINTVSTKTHSGGALQIARNFLLATLGDTTSGVEWIYFTSADVDEALGADFTARGRESYHVLPTQPDFLGSYRQVARRLSELERRLKPDLIYSISSPSYMSFSTPEVMRFSNPWVTHPTPEAWSTLTPAMKLRTRLYCWLQKMMLRRASAFVVQSPTVKAGLTRVTGIDSERVRVVPNVLPLAFSKIDTSGLEHVSPDGCAHVVSVSAAVPHKNIDIIPDVARLLRDSHCISNVKFHVTLPAGSPIWAAVDAKARANGVAGSIINHGRLSQAQLAEIYKYCTVCFLPTLLEVFSASPLEAMHFGLGIVATDYSFNSDVIADAGLYYKPMDAAGAASQIARLLSDPALALELRRKGSARLALYSDYSKHYDAIVDFLKLCGRASSGSGG